MRFRLADLSTGLILFRGRFKRRTLLAGVRRAEAQARGGSQARQLRIREAFAAGRGPLPSSWRGHVSLRSARCSLAEIPARVTKGSQPCTQV